MNRFQEGGLNNLAVDQIQKVKRKARSTRSGNASLIGLLVAAAIVLLLTVIFLKGGIPGFSKPAGPARKDNLGKTVPGAVKADAEDTVCRNNLQQIRLAIQTQQAMDPDGKFPSSLQDLHLPASMLKCPLGGQYIYDPTTGTVHCNHPGHENF